MKRCKGRYPVVITAIVKPLFASTFPGEAWPRGWKVQWGPCGSRYGFCSYTEKTITLSAYHAKKGNNFVRTLVHEFVHMRTRGGRGMEFSSCGHHGKEFYEVMNRALARLWVA